ncbi:cardiolipin synthase [Olivibacter sp. CPCC 100613]|uniref:cardiolipin synthase n=1 Tax=Olivibacter sp. CPCC 100613 TaxID=3079931 RepID=UPI002FF561A3
MPSFDWFIVAEIIYTLLVIGVCLRIIYETRSSTKTLAYLLLTIFVPIAGIILYFSIGINYRNRSMYSKKLLSDQRLQERLKIQIYKSSFDALHSVGDYGLTYKGLAHMILKDMMSPLTANNAIKILINGEQTFREILQAIKQARDHIHLEYYTFEDDVIGNTVKEALIQKAREGVEVRFIYDHFGSRSIDGAFSAELAAAGVEVYPFHKITFLLLANRLNYRNHRKIIVIDGHTSFVGGINVADRYMNEEKQNDGVYWRDTHVCIKGRGTLYLQYIFLCDWNFCSPNKLYPEQRFFSDRSEEGGGSLVQIVSSGPDSVSPSILYTLLQAISTAKEEILITTPYFIPGESLMDALIIAALRGVNVKLLVPYVSDSRIVNAAAHSYYDDLLKAGVRIFRYKKGFIHAKTIVFDNKLAIIGTANMDQRSFDLNFEVMSLILDPQVAEELRKIFNEDLQDAEEMNTERWEHRAKWRKLMEKSARMISPLL